jgi:hypothetical protein
MKYLQVIELKILRVLRGEIFRLIHPYRLIESSGAFFRSNKFSIITIDQQIKNTMIHWGILDFTGWSITDGSNCHALEIWQCGQTLRQAFRIKFFLEHGKFLPVRFQFILQLLY